MSDYSSDGDSSPESDSSRSPVSPKRVEKPRKRPAPKAYPPVATPKKKRTKKEPAESFKPPPKKQSRPKYVAVCQSCKKIGYNQVPLQNAVATPTSNGRTSVKGTCGHCGKGVNTFLAK